MKKKILGLVLMLFLCGIIRLSAENRYGFAIVVDPKTYSEAKEQIHGYAKAIEEMNRLKVYLLQDKWGVPDSIKAHLKELYLRKKQPIEGAVFIGDIPIPMIRDAQYLTSAFKMNQNRDWKESSIPSDRYYDDFSLSFSSLGKDKDHPYFYYSLDANSSQKLEPAIFSGRIRATDVDGVSKYDKIREFLRKAIQEKYHPHQLSQVLYFEGHGYISQSLMARIDEKAGLYEHFPWLKSQKNGIEYISHRQQDVTKFQLMNELQRMDLDFAILHHHGAPDTQYMDGAPDINSAEKAKAFIQEYCRNYLRKMVDRRGQNRDSVLNRLSKRFDVPQEWFNDAWDKDVLRRDSLDNANEDLTVQDFCTYGYQPNCLIIIIDACFNGSYQLDDCIANRYIFNKGRTIAVIANSVNTLQDKWSDRFMGLLGLGAEVGQLVRFSGYLESVLIGDPTACYRSLDNQLKINNLLANNNYKVWSRFLKCTDYPDLQSMAIEQYFRAGKMSSQQLLHFLSNSNSPMVRMEAFVCLEKVGGDALLKAIEIASNDSYELVQRYAFNALGKNGDKLLIPILIRKAISNTISERVASSVKNAIEMYPEELLLKEFDKQFGNDSVKYINKNGVRAQIVNVIRKNSNKWNGDFKNILSDNIPQKKMLSSIRTARNYCPSYYIPLVINRFEQLSNPVVQVALLEMLGWRTLSCYKPQIIDLSKSVISNLKYDEKVREEALRTYNRLIRK